MAQKVRISQLCRVFIPPPPDVCRLSRAYYRYILQLNSDWGEVTFHHDEADMVAELRALCLLASRHNYSVGWVVKNAAQYDLFTKKQYPPNLEIIGPSWNDWKTAAVVVMQDPDWWQNAEC